MGQPIEKNVLNVFLLNRQNKNETKLGLVVYIVVVYAHYVFIVFVCPHDDLKISNVLIRPINVGPAGTAEPGGGGWHVPPPPPPPTSLKVKKVPFFLG
jgi:hypothetical protein